MIPISLNEQKSSIYFLNVLHSSSHVHYNFRGI